MNRIITRGLGTSRGVPGRAGLVTQGYGGSVPPIIPELIESAILRIDRSGRSGERHRVPELDVIMVWAKLIEVNSMPPKRTVKGGERRVVDDRRFRVFAKHVRSRVTTMFERLKITITRIK